MDTRTRLYKYSILLIAHDLTGPIWSIAPMRLLTSLNRNLLRPHTEKHIHIGGVKFIVHLKSSCDQEEGTIVIWKMDKALMGLQKFSWLGCPRCHPNRGKGKAQAEVVKVVLQPSKDPRWEIIGPVNHRTLCFALLQSTLLPPHPASSAGSLVWQG